MAVGHDRFSARRWLAIAVVVAMMTIESATSQPAGAGSPARCGPGDRPEPALQGQVPVSARLNGSAAGGYWCNLETVGSFTSLSQATFDTYEHCAYYADNATIDIDSGVVVLDVSDPQHPRQTAYLTARAMRDAGESLRVNQTRGLLVADHFSWVGHPNPIRAADGIPESPEILRTLAVYDVSRDCAHPTLLADVVLPSQYGHEGCFQPDGMVYYVSAGTVTPIDLTDPAHPEPLSAPWQPPSTTLPVLHGCSISDDGTRGFFTDAVNQSMLVVDTSQVQARVHGAQLRVIGSFATPNEIEQSTVPLYYGSQPYVLLFTEARLPPKQCLAGQANFGFPRIISVTDESHPVEVSRMQSEVVLPQNCAAVAHDSTVQTRGLAQGDTFNLALSGAFGYDSHYCTPDRLHDPTIVACAQLGSGVRVYDVRDPRSPTEIAYYNTGTNGRRDPTLDWAQARPVIRRDLGQIWWATWNKGFHVAQFRQGVWPFPGDPACPPGYDYFRAQYDLTYQRCKAAGTLE